ERGDENARGRFLADPAPAPALLERPFLERALPAQDMPQTRPTRRRDPANRLDGAPDLPARRLDAQPRPVIVGPETALAEAQMRRVEGAQRVEMGQGKPRAEIVAGLPHARGDR